MLEIYSISHESGDEEVKHESERKLEISLQPLLKHNFNSTICSVTPIPGKDRDYLFVVLEYNLTACILYFNEEGTPVETSAGVLKDEAGERRDGPVQISVDLLERRFVSYHAYHGLLKIIPLIEKHELEMEHSFDLYITHKEVLNIELVQRS